MISALFLYSVDGSGGGWDMNRTILRHFLAVCLTVGHPSKIRRHIRVASVFLVGSKEGHLQQIGISIFPFDSLSVC